MNKDKQSLLGRVSLLKGLTSKTLKKISDYAKFRRFRRGEQIFTEDSAGECLYVLVSGRVKIYSTVGTRTKTFALLDAGDFFGEMSLLGQMKRSASARAIRDSELRILERKDFHRFLKMDTEMTLTMLETLCHRLRQADRQIEMLSFENVIGRTAITLLELENKYGRTVAGGNMIDADITQQELADLVGTAREMVSRAVARFRKMNAITMDRGTGKMIILDRQKLKNCIYQ